jgi:alpha-tubulin suppressor-like RCC1 family protein
MLNKLYLIIIIIILIIIVIKVQYYFKTIEEFTTVIYVTDDRTTGKYGIRCLKTPGLYSCGWNDKGQLGLGPSNTDDINIPTLIQNISKIVKISCGGIFHSLFLTYDGHVYSCGNNDYGQLGLGNYDDYYIPKLIDDLYNINIIKISAGGYHSLFLTDGGDVYSCGYNYSGQLGLDNNKNQNRPKLIQNFYNNTSYIKYGDITIIEISSGDVHSLFLTDGGDVYSCGNNNYYGQLGLGNNNNKNIPTLIQYFYNNDEIKINNDEIKINNDEITIIEISTGSYHSLFLTDNGDVYSCGYNYFGQLGLGNNNNKNIPTLIQYFYNNDEIKINNNEITIIEISAGSYHSLFLTDDGNVYSCGYNYSGQLGLDNNYNQNIPTLIKSFNNDDEIKINNYEITIIEISAGGYHNLFLTDDGYVYSCGYNNYGQLGLGIYDWRINIPTLIKNFNNIGKISAGSYHSLFLELEQYFQNTYISDGEYTSRITNYITSDEEEEEEE